MRESFIKLLCWVLIVPASVSSQTIDATVFKLNFKIFSANQQHAPVNDVIAIKILPCTVTKLILVISSPQKKKFDLNQTRVVYSNLPNDINYRHISQLLRYYFIYVFKLI